MLGLDEAEHLAQAYYAEQLEHSPAALDYLAHRGVPPELARRLGLGYAPDRWTALVDHLRSMGVTAAEAHDAGVGMPTSRGTIVDALRRRLIFPGRDERGNVVGFTGRAAPGSPAHSPRYLDTYRRGVKGQVLHGLADGRACLARGAMPVLVEGPLDAVNVTPHHRRTLCRPRPPSACRTSGWEEGRSVDEAQVVAAVKRSPRAPAPAQAG